MPDGGFFSNLGCVYDLSYVADLISENLPVLRKVSVRHVVFSYMLMKTRMLTVVYLLFTNE